MRRDLRDPESLGKVLLGLVKHQKVPVLVAADELTAYEIKQYASNETCIEKYGRPGEAPERWERIQTR